MARPRLAIAGSFRGFLFYLHLPEKGLDVPLPTMQLSPQKKERMSPRPHKERLTQENI
jgi:hypothetical protein